MYLAVVLVLFLASDLDQVKAQGTGTCIFSMSYNGIATIGAKRVRARTNSECRRACLRNRDCLSFHLNPSKRGCWVQTKPEFAYQYRSAPEFVQHELPCRIPNNGCPYEVYVYREDPGTIFQTNVDGINPMMCHRWCTENQDVCNVWRWDINEGVEQRCQYALSASPSSFSYAYRIYLFIVSCPKV